MLSMYKGGKIGKRPLTRGLWLTGRAHALQDCLLKKKKKFMKRPRDQRTMGYKACPRLASSIQSKKKKEGKRKKFWGTCTGCTANGNWLVSETPPVKHCGYW